MARGVDPWFRQNREPLDAYNAFKLYRGEFVDGKLTTEPIRKIQKLAESTGISYALISRWSSRFKWKARALAFDNFVDANEKDELEYLARGIGRRARARRLKEYDQLEMLVDVLRQKCADIAQASKGRMFREKSTKVVKERYDDGKEKTIHITIVEPAGWRLRDMAILAGKSVTIADRMFRLVLGADGSLGLEIEGADEDGKRKMSPEHAAAGLDAIMKLVRGEEAADVQSNGKQDHADD